MSTLADLVNLKIGPSRRAVFVEPASDGFRVLVCQERAGPRAVPVWRRYRGVTAAELLREEQVGRESVYYVLPPRSYYRNRLGFPFQDRAKIEAVIPYEIRDYLPGQEQDCVSDFVQFDGEALVFSADRETIRRVVEQMEEFKDNLRAVIPFDHAVYRAMRGIVGEGPYLLVGLSEEGVYLQQAFDRHLGAGMFSGPGDDPRDTGALEAQLRMLLRAGGEAPVYLAAPQEAESTGETTGRLLAVLDEAGPSARARPLAAPQGGSSPGSSRAGALLPVGAPVDPHVLALMGALDWAQGAGPRAADRVNLLKDQFRPRPRGYVSLKELGIAGVLLLMLLILSTAGLVMDIRLGRRRVEQLREGMERVTAAAFEEPVTEVAEARRMVQELRGRIDQVERNTDRSRSSLLLLRELGLYFPGDVAVEYTDLVIEPARIRLEGRARAFSDVDKMQRELEMSDRFAEVTVANTGTTGSTEGFTVTFALDIRVREAQR
ncbi:MAG: hypothetical protein ACOC8N_02120 [Spirochaetota bacterium]